jgi:hypothetical protein
MPTVSHSKMRKRQNRSCIRKACDNVLRITSQTAMYATDLTFASYRNDKKEIKSYKDSIRKLFGHSNDADVIIQWAVDTGKEIVFLEKQKTKSVHQAKKRRKG